MESQLWNWCLLGCWTANLHRYSWMQRSNALSNFFSELSAANSYFSRSLCKFNDISISALGRPMNYRKYKDDYVHPELLRCVIILTLFTALSTDLFTAPLGSMLVARIGCKWAVLVGAICSTLGFGLTAFCNQVWQGVLSYGILAGKSSCKLWCC